MSRSDLISRIEEVQKIGLSNKLILEYLTDLSQKMLMVSFFKIVFSDGTVKYIDPLLTESWQDNPLEEKYSVPFTTSASELIDDPQIDIVVELIGGRALGNGLSDPGLHGLFETFLRP